VQKKSQEQKEFTNRMYFVKKGEKKTGKKQTNPQTNGQKQEKSQPHNKLKSTKLVTMPTQKKWGRQGSGGDTQSLARKSEKEKGEKTQKSEWGKDQSGWGKKMGGKEHDGKFNSRGGGWGGGGQNQ